MIEHSQVLGYREHLKGLLTGESLGIPKDRLDWSGYTEALKVYFQATDAQRPAVIEAIAQIITEEQDWGLVADTVHLAYHLKIGELRPTVGDFKEKRLGKVNEEWREVVGRQINTYLLGASPQDK